MFIGVINNANEGEISSVTINIINDLHIGGGVTGGLRVYSYLQHDTLSNINHINSVVKLRNNNHNCDLHRIMQV